MVVHQIYAQIYEGEVKHIMVCDNYELANYIARATYGDEAFAVDCLQYRCCIGDKYHDNTFFAIAADGTETQVAYEPTQEQQVSVLTYQMDKESEYNMELDYRTSKLELGL